METETEGGGLLKMGAQIGGSEGTATETGGRGCDRGDGGSVQGLAEEPGSGRAGRASIGIAREADREEGDDWEPEQRALGAARSAEEGNVVATEDAGGND